MVRGDLPGVAPLVLDHAAAVAIGHVRRRLERARAGGERAPIGGVGIVDVDVEKGGHRRTRSGFANHHYRDADPELRWPLVLVIALGAEHLLEERDQPLRIARHDARRHRVPAGRSKGGMIGDLLCHAVSFVLCCQSSLSLSRSTLPRSLFGSSATKNTCLGTFGAGSAARQCAAIALSLKIAPGRCTT